MNALVKQMGTKITNIENWLPELNSNKTYLGWYLKAYEDMIDAVVSALTGLDYLKNNISGYGSLDGTIWVPLNIL